jgi:hypothetical protein
MRQAAHRGRESFSKRRTLSAEMLSCPPDEIRSLGGLGERDEEYPFIVRMSGCD